MAIDTIKSKMNEVITTLKEAKEEEEMGFEHQSYKTLIDFGKHIQPLDEKFKTKEFMIDKCTSTVYLVCSINKNTTFDSNTDSSNIHLEGDSDAQFVKGELGIIFFIFEKESIADIASIETKTAFDTFFTELEQFVPISLNRKRGFVSIFEKIREFAISKQKSKQKTD